MFEFLKKDDKKVEVTITLDRPDQPYFPGNTVHAQISIEGKEQVKIREARVALLARDMCLYQDDTYTGDFSTGTTNWASFDQEVTRQMLIEQSVIAEGENQAFEFSATIPNDAQPTCKLGAFVKLSWLVEVTLDRPMAPDIHGETELTVFSAPPGKTITAGEYGQSNEPDQAEMTFYLPKKEWVLGEPLEGELRLKSKAEFEVTEVRISLAQVETVYQGRGNQYKVKTETLAAENIKLQAGQTLTYPFSFTIPDDGQVTVNTGSGSISWMVKGVLARHMRPDTYIEEEIFVYSTKSTGQ